MRTAAFFVTGTDTGVGKTTVAAGLLAAVRRRGYPVAALKPAETGCARLADGALHPSDGALLREAAGLESLPIDTVVPFRLETPVAPAAAARREGASFSLATVLAARERLVASRPSLFLVEGAGGLLVPYSDAVLGADIAHAFDLPLLIVARSGLGTINHTLLTVAEARRRGLAVAGVVLSRTGELETPDESDNPCYIQQLCSAPVLGTVPHLGPALRRECTALADAVEAAGLVTRLLPWLE